MLRISRSSIGMFQAGQAFSETADSKSTSIPIMGIMRQHGD